MKKGKQDQQPAPVTGETVLQELYQRQAARLKFRPQAKQSDGLSEDRRTMMSYYRNFQRRYFLND